MYKAVLFDLDGTLINSLEDLADSANYALTQKGYPVHETEKYKYFVGDGVAKLMERILPEDKRNKVEAEGLLNIYLPYYKEHSFDKTQPYEGIKEALFNLKKRGIKLAVVTNKPDLHAKVIVERFFGGRLFEAVMGNTSDCPVKPAPDIVIKTLSLLGNNPQETFFVGDTAVDMLTAKNSGCIPVGVTWGFRTSEELLLNGAELIIDNPCELETLINF